MRWRIRLALALAPCLAASACSETTEPPPTVAPPFEAGELRLLESLSLASLKPPAASRSNAFADDESAAQLGRKLFFDPRLSENGEVSCSSCHQPELHFTDGRKTSIGLGVTPRNAPSVVGAAYSPFLFWDGRRDSLWSQALAPLETPAEMGWSRLEVVRYVTTDERYGDEYAALFGRAPDFADASTFPMRASPYGDAERREAWERLSQPARESINRAFSNVGKALEAYERRLLPGPSRFDRYVDHLMAGDGKGASTLLDPDEVAGLRLFLDVSRTQCLRCHNGPLLTNQAFHDVASGRMGSVPDLGRFLGIDSVLQSEFNCLGPYSDAPDDACNELRFLDRRQAARATGAFKTPSLRDVGRTAPYFHDGALGTLRDVIDHYRNVDDSRGSEITRLDVTDQEASQIVAFLRTLSGGVASGTQWGTPTQPGATFDTRMVPEALE